jgi:hypothetical protein
MSERPFYIEPLASSSPNVDYSKRAFSGRLSPGDEQRPRQYSEENRLTMSRVNTHDDLCGRATTSGRLQAAEANQHELSVSSLHAIGVGESANSGVDSASAQPALTLSAAARRRASSKTPKSITCCTRIIKLMFSNVGLVLAVFIYSTAGALMFKLLEQHEELRLCEEGNA